MQMLHAIQQGEIETAESIRRWFMPLEDLRNEINPIRVLHHAVSAAKIADTGPLLPMLSDLPADAICRIEDAVRTMMSSV